jgi:hypothetical protein
LDDERSRLRNGTDLVTKQQPKTCAGSLVNSPGIGSTSQIGPRDDGRRSRAGARNNAQEERSGAALRIPSNEERLACNDVRRSVYDDSIDGRHNGGKEGGD